MNTLEGGVNVPLGCSKRLKCGYPKSQDGRSNLTQFLTFLLDFALDATTFVVSGFTGFLKVKRLKTLDTSGFSASFKFC